MKIPGKHDKLGLFWGMVVPLLLAAVVWFSALKIFDGVVYGNGVPGEWLAVWAVSALTYFGLKHRLNP